ncbi:MAG TPA: glycosyltransferase [Opitutaceae bacterium]|nr:glycosyltransferase [Opitutaceae bacterium]
MNRLRASVIICTRNPREVYFSRVLSALAAQSQTPSEWELVVVDNGSTPAIAERGFTLPSNGRVVIEREAGLTPARLRGIAEATGDLLVFVDDDNVLAPDYLDRAVGVSDEFPKIGVWGGRLLPEFETEPDDWLKPYLKNLALIDFDRDRWTNQRDFSIFPPGAGMCVRRKIAEDYVLRLASDPLRRGLDRIGTQLGSGGDTDLVIQAIDTGWGIGQFTRLSLTHLIPRERLTLDYHKRLAEGISRSAGQLSAAHGTTRPDILRNRLRGWISVLRSRGRARVITAAATRGWLRGLKVGWELRARESK